jgi:uncharacterized protein (DUF2062 family)
MLFRRKNPVSLGQRIRDVLWPRRSFWRSAKYFTKRLLRLSATPHAVAAGVAAGVFVSFLPIPGFHFLLAAAVGWVLGGNVVASALGTAVGNPLTFPLIWGATYELGRFLLHGRAIDGVEPLQVGVALRNFSFSQIWEPLLKPMTVGAIPLGLAFALVFYVVMRWTVAVFQEQRRLRPARLTRSDETRNEAAEL